MAKVIKTTLIFDANGNLTDFDTVVMFVSSLENIAALYKSKESAGDIAYEGETLDLSPVPISTRVENVVHSENKLMFDIYVNYFNGTQKITKIIERAKEEQ